MAHCFAHEEMEHAHFRFLVESEALRKAEQEQGQVDSPTV